MSREKDKGFIAEFKKFIMRGNVMDMAVGVIVGGAFTSIVTSLNQDILTPILGIFQFICEAGERRECACADLRKFPDRSGEFFNYSTGDFLSGKRFK